MQTLNLLVTERCCGKTILHSINPNFIDFDIFRSGFFELKESEEIIVFMINSILKNNKDAIFMINFGWFEAISFLKKYFDLNVICYIPEPTEESRDFRIKISEVRDYKKYGAPRIKYITKNYANFFNIINNFISWAKENNYKTVMLKPEEFIAEKLKS